MAYRNGRVPAWALASIPAVDQRNGRASTVKVLRATASAFHAMREACFDATGVLLVASGPCGGNRSLKLQAWMHTNYRWLWPILAAVGYSNHGYGNRIDINNWGSARNWLANHADEFGMRLEIAGERWHYVHNGVAFAGGGTAVLVEMEIDMADFLLLFDRKTGKRAVTVPGSYFREITKAESLVAGDCLRMIRPGLNSHTPQAKVTENVTTERWNFLRTLVPATGGLDPAALATALAPLLAPHIGGASAAEVERIVTEAVASIVAEIPTVFKAAG